MYLLCSGLDTDELGVLFPDDLTELFSDIESGCWMIRPKRVRNKLRNNLSGIIL